MGHVESGQRLVAAAPLDLDAQHGLVLGAGSAQDGNRRERLGVDACHQERLTGLDLAPHLADLDAPRHYRTEHRGIPAGMSTASPPWAWPPENPMVPPRIEVSE